MAFTGAFFYRKATGGKGEVKIRPSREGNVIVCPDFSKKDEGNRTWTLRGTELVDISFERSRREPGKPGPERERQPRRAKWGLVRNRREPGGRGRIHGASEPVGEKDLTR